jgi:hypothetical protein
LNAHNRYELLVGRTPFRARQNEQTLANIVNSKKHLQSNLYLCRQGSNAAGSLIRGLLEPNPALRLGNVGGHTKQQMNGLAAFLFLFFCLLEL